jgi:streptogramin lyase
MTQIVFTELIGGRVLSIDDDLDTASLRSVGDSALAGPSGPAFDSHGAVLVAELDLHTIALAEPGAGWQRFGTHGSGVGEFNRPVATAFLKLDQLIVLDSGNRRLVFMDDLSGSGWTTYGHSGLHPLEGGFVDPRGLAVDASDRIWVSDPGANRLTRLDSPDGAGWIEIALPAAANRPIPYGIGTHGAGVVLVDAGNARLLVLDGDGTTSATVDLGDGTWVSPTFTTSAGTNLVVGDAVANELRLLEPGGQGFRATAVLRGSPPDVLEPLFDSLGGVGS